MQAKNIEFDLQIKFLLYLGSSSIENGSLTEKEYSDLQDAFYAGAFVINNDFYEYFCKLEGEDAKEQAIRLLDCQFQQYIFKKIEVENLATTKNRCMRCAVEVESGFWCNECVMYK